MNLNEGKPLTPLTSGIVLLVGVKASNFDEEIKTHPRVVMWESQNEHWTDKDLPSNTRAVFMTRFIGHAAFKNIVREARKRHITIFNPMGTGIIARQVRELLSIGAVHPTTIEPVIHHNEVVEIKETKVIPRPKLGRLKPLMELIDMSKTNIENARVMFAEAQRLGIQTTLSSLAQVMVGQRRKLKVKPFAEKKQGEQKDVSVEMFDNIIKSMVDMRDFVVATTKENTLLKARLQNLKKALGE